MLLVSVSGGWSGWLLELAAEALASAARTPAMFHSCPSLAALLEVEVLVGIGSSGMGSMAAGSVSIDSSESLNSEEDMPAWQSWRLAGAQS